MSERNTLPSDPHSVPGRGAKLPGPDAEVPAASASRSPIASVSAAIAEVNAHLQVPQQESPREPRFPGEDGGHSLAEMAHRDLDAVLQLLADRAQYITGAAAAAIALRRGHHHDMLCRASTGAPAPELGSLLSMDYGLSGQCVRERQPLRCDDTERDPRVNHEVCRQLGIASVVVMPLLADDQVLGVFELFSGTPRVFEERDVSALRRLGEMVTTAVKHAAASQAVSVAPKAAEMRSSKIPIQTANESAYVESADFAEAGRERSVPSEIAPPTIASASSVIGKAEPKLKPEAEAETKSEATKTGAQPKKPLFWTAAIQTRSKSEASEDVKQSTAVPATLRTLQKCQACGFPVSQGRVLCVECEEKQWRGKTPLRRSEEDRAEKRQLQMQQKDSIRVVGPAAHSEQTDVPVSSESFVSTSASTSEPRSGSSISDGGVMSASAQEAVPDQQDTAVAISSVSFLGSVQPAESWVSANKYVLISLLVVAAAIAAVAWLR
jgi:hypothetical protein